MGEKTEKFRAYILERTKPEAQADMNALIDDVVAKQKSGNLSTTSLMTLVPKAMGMIQPGALGEVRDYMLKMKDNLK
ncbi:hypothetical protein FC83_GL003091 [Agrilactobacillus composti DSM 18527 = JCM 14202]|uniref:Uncharacterized protein n=1 Tax=Agrilactobacillus composti DSM 18527 = JCM 14202 TaxID=1423734 RepID=A0A0R1XS70_9LACO|nr:hypothetical protein [Agrilactobacillus composti]KRM33018.1 hypothetical protein FC83_GL003091 [Agrilactobacillus composti DSM 18527 = JCM 14202]